MCKFKISECVRQKELEKEHGRVLIVVFLGWRIHEGQPKAANNTQSNQFGQIY